MSFIKASWMADSKQNTSEKKISYAGKTCQGQWMSEEREPGLVSIIIPTYNRAQLLSATLASVAEQDYRPLEVIISDDGSSDNSADVVAAWRESVAGSGIDVRYLHFPNAGAPTARNRGMAEAQGEFIQFLDSDCLLAPEKISSQVQTLSDHPECDFAYCRTAFVTPEGYSLYETGKPLDPDPLVNVVDSLFTCIAPLWRYRVIQDIRWVVELPCWQDWVFNAHVLMRSQAGIYDACFLCRAVIHEGEQISEFGTIHYVRGSLQAACIMEQLIGAGPAAEAARRILGQRYLSIFKSALKLPDYPLAGQALAQAIETGRSLRKVQLCFWPSRILGLRLFRLLLRSSGRL